MCRRWLGGGSEGKRVLVKGRMDGMWRRDGVGRDGVGRREAWLKEGYLVAEPFVCNGC